MKTVVVLGGSGFIGRNLSPALAALGYEVHSVSRSPVVVRDPRVNYIDCNYDNIYQLGEIYAAADVIFHLAWDTTPATSSRQSSLEVSANLLPSLRLLEYLEHNARAHLVFVSSGGTVYGDCELDVVSEAVHVSPIAHYGAGKGAMELFLHSFQRQSGRAVSVLRPANLYGPGQLAKQQFGVIPTLLTALKTDTAFRVMGDGENRRDFVYIDDFVSLCLRLCEGQSRPNEYALFNVGSGHGVSLNELMSLAQQVSGKPLRIERQPARQVDVRSIVLDSSKLAAAWGWSASTGIEDGLVSTWQWISARDLHD
jgi:UDP-glucose 4-epimerase